ncbi:MULTISPECIES: 4'-phosphopantetheinyl transferase superfamily protein [unclassified Agrobacterium]|uniref:4'-phosphopantetheinyl transferase family protein n=1 Tax=unclassified Agrobacterium TaxID=2632611 RepID=UPI00244D3727|nr:MULTISPECIES: 4'-phosphopantetheinyl transferase superfamily protein [unclassified Agrobacterium]MDH0615173.1 4'-phosphopantetheinyl transferase superfamily protein [Agrobacterium sp. GD03872]MDH0698220.1 4'-phosphopantetheinyl transferase superfamily protein [Agrobacterium sp. GD03871]MDH1060246.1 4'-phosphopantetheinyl transferase superfamily protein [Agrobacterium sp. GD03992]MDH2212002.1 4'-phosphopantetheinyl transferase superfamily protein [Agrobacterium sp. GD03643]MDH2220285.1 4'-ph
MGIATAFHREAASGDPPEAIWPWPDDRRDCHCFTLRYSADEGCGGTVPPLPPQLLHATPRRKAEFIAGRRCAAEAIRHLTGRTVFPGMGDDRAPAWPEGVIGAISHSHERAIALAGSSERFCGIGIDIERFLTEEEADDIAPQALTANERHNLGNAIDPFMIGLIFSAKESLFKALYPTVKRPFFFEAAELSGFDGSGCATLRLTADLSEKWRGGTEIPFRFCRFEDFLLTRILFPH